MFLIKQNVASLFGIMMNMVQGFWILALVFTVDGDPYTAVIGELILPSIKYLTNQTPRPVKNCPVTYVFL